MSRRKKGPKRVVVGDAPLPGDPPTIDGHPYITTPYEGGRCAWSKWTGYYIKNLPPYPKATPEPEPDKPIYNLMDNLKRVLDEKKVKRS